MKSVILGADGNLDTFVWQRTLETIGSQGRPALQSGPKGELNSMCQPGELTDRGRETTLALGQRFRQLYVNRLKFLPEFLDEDSRSNVRLQATVVPRALESVQQSFNGLYPPASRSPGLAPPEVIQRLYPDDTLLPNQGTCKRLKQLSTAFAERTAKLWNDSPEIIYLNKRLGKWMPKESPSIAVDSSPRLSGIMDTINATRAHGPATKLPEEFYDPQVLSNINRVVTEEWFIGYQESNEYRRLGIGALIGDLTQRMVENVRGLPVENAIKPFKLGMAGCHDTTIAATLTALGAFRVDQDLWPNFTSSIAFELFQTKNGTDSKAKPTPSWSSSIFSMTKPSASSALSTREPLSSLSSSERQQLDNHYVRIRYNDTPVTIPHCELPGNHLPSDTTFCTLAAFKQVADQMTPLDWRAECSSNLKESAFPSKVEPVMGTD
jgi:acid phosphatase